MPEYNCDWLDTSIVMSINFHIPSGKVGMPIQDYSVVQRFGQKIGIVPQLDREGFTFSTLQPLLLIEIVKLRNELIKTSDKALDPNWFFKLRELIITTISIVEITLMQFYLKAEYTYNPTWTFDKSILGERFGRRLMDKIRWIKQITGVQPNITNELDALKELKQIRNHLNHFDPPSFCATLEEVERWLNDG